MNSSASSHSTSTECEVVIFMGGRLGHSAVEAYAFLVFVIILNIITCPITVVLNALVVYAVTTKPRLKTKSNVVLGCLATTDCLVGVIGQPLFIAWITVSLQEEASKMNCLVMELSKHTIRVLAATSLLHVALMNVERYIAIKQPFAYITMVTQSRILRSSALAWIAIFLLSVPLAIIDNDIYLTASNITGSLCIAITIYCQAVVYFQIRRQEKQMAAHQVTAEAKQKFLNEKRAFKLTTTVVLVLVLSFSPIIVVRILIVKSVINSVNVTSSSFFLGSLLGVLNSLFNPIIYCVRMRQFRVAFIEIVLRKSNAQAEEIERQVFGTLNAVAPDEGGQEREEGQNNEQSSSDNRDNNNNYDSKNNNNSDSNSNNDNNSCIDRSNNTNINDNNSNNNYNYSSDNNSNDKKNNNCNDDSSNNSSSNKDHNGGSNNSSNSSSNNNSHNDNNDNNGNNKNGDSNTSKDINISDNDSNIKKKAHNTDNGNDCGTGDL